MSYWTNSQENNPQMKQWLKKVSCSPVLHTLYPVPHSSILKWLRHLVNWGSFKRTNISKASSEIKSKAISNWCLIPPWKNLWISILSVWTLYSRGEAEHLAWTQSWIGVGTLPVEWEWLAPRADWSQKVCPEEGHIVGLPLCQEQWQQWDKQMTPCWWRLA